MHITIIFFCLLKKFLSRGRLFHGRPGLLVIGPQGELVANQVGVDPVRGKTYHFHACPLVMEIVLQ